MLVHCRRPIPIQYWAVLYVQVSVSTEHTLTQTQRRLNVEPAPPALIIIYTAPGTVILLAFRVWLQCLVYTRTPTQCPAQYWPTVCNAGTTPNQHSITMHVHQEENNIIRTVCGLRLHSYVFIGTKTLGNHSQGWFDFGELHEHRPNIQLALRQHVD